MQNRFERFAGFERGGPLRHPFSYFQGEGGGDWPRRLDLEVCAWRLRTKP